MEILTQHLPGYIVMEKNSRTGFPLKVERVAVWVNPRLSNEPTVCVYCSCPNKEGIFCYRMDELYIVRSIEQHMLPSKKIDVKFDSLKWFKFKTLADVDDIICYEIGNNKNSAKIVDIEIIIDIYQGELDFDIYYTINSGRRYEQTQLFIEQMDVKNMPRYFKAM
jgi:hypothetical protein